MTLPPDGLGTPIVPPGNPPVFFLLFVFIMLLIGKSLIFYEVNGIPFYVLIVIFISFIGVAAGWHWLRDEKKLKQLAVFQIAVGAAYGTYAVLALTGVNQIFNAAAAVFTIANGIEKYRKLDEAITQAAKELAMAEAKVAKSAQQTRKKNISVG